MACMKTKETTTEDFNINLEILQRISDFEDTPITVRSNAVFTGFTKNRKLEIRCDICGAKPDPTLLDDTTEECRFQLLANHISLCPSCPNALMFIAYSLETWRSQKRKETGSNDLELDCCRERNLSGNWNESLIEIRNKAELFKSNAEQLTLNIKFIKKLIKTESSKEHEAVRLMSFSNWEYSKIVTPVALANGGFYRFESSPRPDAVKCFSCGLILVNWRVGDIVSEEHRKKRPNCEFVKDPKSTNNVSIEIELLRCHRLMEFMKNDYFVNNDGTECFMKVSKLLQNKDDYLFSTDDKILGDLNIDLPEDKGYKFRVNAEHQSKEEFDDPPNCPTDVSNRSPLKTISKNYNNNNNINGNSINSSNDINAIYIGASNINGNNINKSITNNRVRDCNGSIDKSRHWKTKLFTAGEKTNLKERLQFLKEENQKLRELKQCKLCLDRDMDTVLLPCGHFMCCGECAAKINNCAVCRLIIRGTVNAFVPYD